MLMESNGLFCELNTPAALKSTGSGDEEFSHGLPPYAKTKAYLVDKYPGCPKNWMRSHGIWASYFAPVDEDSGLWIDLNKNESHSHHVAAVISVQGVNPITGMPCNDPQLEQYLEKCPKHDIEFGPNRFCEKCGHKWPKQNYICTTGTPNGSFWLDGFRAADGIVRQYILSEEKMRGVAANVVGEDRVFAIGISFFLSKEKKPEVQHATWRCMSNEWDSNPIYGSQVKYLYNPSHTTCDSLGTTKGIIGSSGETKGSLSLDGLSEPTASYMCSTSDVSAMNSAPRSLAKPIKTKKLEVAAGAKITQQVHDDTEDLDFWKDRPESVICVNYCLKADCKKIIEQGEIDLEGSSEGFLQDIPAGN